VAAQPDQGFNTPADLPQAVPPPLENLRAEANSFLEKGDMLLKAGDIIAARQFYLQAHELQSTDGTYGVARTYDPKVFAQLNVRGLSPNPVKALEWYGKAAAAGHAAAAQELLAPPQ
jgi:TPR repeat protein